MTPEQIEEFESRGLTRLPGAVDEEVVRGICERLWERVAEKLDMHRDDPTTWRRVPPAIVKGLKEREGLFEPILAPVVREALDELVGTDGWREPAQPGQLIMTPPGEGEWLLPRTVWHMDGPAPGWVEGPPGAQVFLLLHRLEPHEGGTLVVGGSHRLVREMPERRDRSYEGHSGEVRKALAGRVPWLRDLWQEGPNQERIERLVMRSTDHEGVELRILELTGEAGEVFVMHPWALHAPSPNCSGRMRTMVTERLWAKHLVLFRRSAQEAP